MSLFHDECRRFQMNSRTFSTLRIEFTFIPRLELMSQLFRSSTVMWTLDTLLGICS